MPVVQIRNADAQMLGSADHLFYDDRNFAGEWYNNAVSASYIAAINVPLNVTRFNAVPQVYSLGADIITLLEAGFYVISFLVVAQKTTFSATEGSFYAFLEEDPATGTFATVPASTAYATCFSAPGSCYGSAIVLTQANYRYRVRSATHGVPHTMLANSCNLSIFRLYKNG